VPRARQFYSIARELAEKAQQQSAKAEDVFEIS
jgi:hypothetical protein